MTPAPVESWTWSPLKWFVVLAIILALQAVFFLGFARPVMPPHPPSSRAPGLAVYIPYRATAELPGAVSPPILARPSLRGFSGAWLQIPPLAFNPDESNPPPKALELQPDTLGADISDTVTNRLARPFEVARAPGPRFDAMDYLPPAAPGNLQSTLSVEGELARRVLLSAPVLNLQYADSNLANTVVQITVDNQGREFTPPVLLEPSGSTDADNDALAVARSIRFGPVLRVPGHPPPDPNKLTPGRLVFHWQTQPRPGAATNDPPLPRVP